MPDKPRQKPQPRTPAPDPHLPRWLTISIVAAFALATLIHIAIDIAIASYDGGTTSLMLGGIVGASLAGDRINATKNGNG